MNAPHPKAPAKAPALAVYRYLDCGIFACGFARVLDHLPPPRQQLVRYWGYYSNVSRGKRRRAASRRLAGAAEPGDETAFVPGTLTGELGVRFR